MDTTPLWFDVSIERFPSLASDITCDVLVIGGGITGMTTAYLLGQSGVDVVLVERGSIAGRETGHTTAHITNVTDLSLRELKARFGANRACAVRAAGDAAITKMEQIIRKENIACDFHEVSGFLLASMDPGNTGDEGLIEQEAKLAHDIARDAVTKIAKLPVFERPAVQFSRQFKFHPRKYISMLAQRATGCRIFEQSAVTQFDRKLRTVTVNDRKIHCRYLVLATHYPLSGFSSTASAMLLQTKLAAYSTYVIGARLPSGGVDEALYWDSQDPYFYLRIERGPDFNYAIFGGEDHKTGQNPVPQQAFDRLETVLRHWFPDAHVDRRWSGQVIESVDGLPYIGENTQNQFIATGFAGNGMTFGTLAATIAHDTILKGSQDWGDLFAVDRKELSATGEYIAENKDYPLHLIGDRLKRREKLDIFRTIKPDEGCILKKAGTSFAVYRTNAGDPLILSAVCPHLGCIVAWNSTEKTWDCPCHGSRFKVTGEVLAGPALKGLKRLSWE